MTMKTLTRPIAMLCSTIVLFALSHFALLAWAESGSIGFLTLGITTSIVAGIGFFSFAISIANLRQPSAASVAAQNMDFPMIPRRAPVPRSRLAQPAATPDVADVDSDEKRD